MIIAKLYKWLFLSLLLVLTTNGLQAQSSLSFQKISFPGSQPSNVVLNINHDVKGRVWLSSAAAIYRYDGYKLKVYKHDDAEPNSLPAGNNGMMLEFPAGKLWVTAAGSTGNLDPVTGNYSPVKPGGKEIKGILKIGKIDDDNLLLSSFDYSLYYNHQTGAGDTTFIRLKDGTRQSEFVYPSSKLTSGNGERVFFYKNALHPVRWDAIHHEFSITDSLAFWREIKPDTSIRDFMIDKLRRIWVFYDENSAHRYRIYDSAGHEISAATGMTPAFSKTIAHITEDDYGNVWLGGGGLYILEKNKTSLRSLSAEFPELDYTCTSISKDSHGIIWTAFRGSGVYKFDLRKQPFFNITVSSIRGEGLAKNFILGMFPLQNKKILVRHDFNASQFSLLDPSDLKANPVAIKQLPEIFEIQKVIGSLKKNISDSSLVHTRLRSIRETLLPVLLPRFLPADDGRLYRLDNNAVLNMQEEKILNNITPITSHFIGDTIWLCTEESGLMAWHSKSGKIKQYLHEPGNNSSISTNRVLDILPDKKGNFWVGTVGGLNYFDRTSGKFIRYTVKDGLCDNVIYSFTYDHRGNIWLGTGNGLSCFDTARKRFINYFPGDGLINSEYNRLSAFTAPDGKIFMGGTNGIDYFNPDELQLQNYSISPFISEVIVNDKPVSAEHSLTLQPGEYGFVFTFSADDLGFTEGYTFQYKLEGAEESWNLLRGSNEVRYAGLKSGEYRLLVKVANHHGSWSNDIASYEFSIKPFWWKTKWFVATVVLFLLAVMFLFYRYRIRQLKKMYELRSALSRDLHDEVGSSLSGISLLGQIAQQQLKDQKINEASGIIEKISGYSTEMVNRISDIVWAVNPQNENLDKLMERLQSYASSIAGAQSILFNFKNETGNAYRKIKMPVLKNLYLICKEALNNALKYSHCRTLNCFITSENNCLQVMIEDDGPGFDYNTVAEGNGLKNMKKRAAEIKAVLRIDSQPGHGTKILLQLKTP